LVSGQKIRLNLLPVAEGENGLVVRRGGEKKGEGDRPCTRASAVDWVEKVCSLI